MHPSGRSLVCGMSIGGLERVDLQPSSSGGPPQLTLSQGAAGQKRAGELDLGSSLPPAKGSMSRSWWPSRSPNTFGRRKLE